MRKILTALIAAAATGTMIAGAGVASASPTHPAITAHPATAAHPAGSHRARTGTEHFQAVSTSLTSNRSKVLAFGVFNASGVDISTSNTRDTFKFPGGTFRVTHKVTHSTQHFNKAICAARAHQRGTYRISHGTGKYAGIRGHGRFTVNVLLVDRHTAHGCSHRPIGIQVIIRALGPVTLP
jgi:hypothetical protein